MARPFLVASLDVESSILVIMMHGQTCRFCNCNVGIRFDSFQVGCEMAARFLLGVYSLRNFVFLTASRLSPADNPGAEIR